MPYTEDQIDYKFGNLTRDLAALTDTVDELKGSTDTFYFITVGALVFFMQAGFGLLEAGFGACGSLEHGITYISQIRNV